MKGAKEGGDDTAHGLSGYSKEGDPEGEAAPYEGKGGALEGAAGPGERSSIRIGKHGSSARITDIEPTGNWLHAAGHIATIICTPAAYAPLPLAFSQLTWSAGVILLTLAALTTWYTSILLSSLDRWDGKRHLRYCDLAESIKGRSGKWAVIVFQQIASIGNNITIQIVAGQSMKALYRLFHSDDPNCLPSPGQCGISLQAWIAIFGAVQLILCQLPDISSLREINMLCTLSTCLFALGSLVMSIYTGYSQVDRSTVSYDLAEGSVTDHAFNALFAQGTLAFAFGDSILPEVQATCREPAKRTMYKGVSLAYAIIFASYMSVAVSGYWAFGNAVLPFIVQSFSQPSGMVAALYIFAIIQTAGCYQIYARPTVGFVYMYAIREHQSTWSPWNVGVRALTTTAYMAIVTLICCAIPFFGDFVAFVGACGFTPMDFILPVILWLSAKKRSTPVAIANWCIVVFYTCVSVAGAVGSVHNIINDVSLYSGFADLY